MDAGKRVRERFGRRPRASLAAKPVWLTPRLPGHSGWHLGRGGRLALVPRGEDESAGAWRAALSPSLRCWLLDGAEDQSKCLNREESRCPSRNGLPQRASQQSLHAAPVKGQQKSAPSLRRVRRREGVPPYASSEQPELLGIGGRVSGARMISLDRFCRGRGSSYGGRRVESRAHIRR